MAIYRPNYKLIEATKAVENLSDSKNDELIAYYIEHQQDTIIAQNKKLEEYKHFFKTLNSFLPKNNPNRIA